MRRAGGVGARVRLALVPWPGPAAPVESILREGLEGEGFDVFAWSDAADADYRPHAHDHDESLWVVDGDITFGIDGTPHRLGPGDRLMLPAGTVHTAHAGPHGARYLIGQRRS